MVVETVRELELKRGKGTGTLMAIGSLMQHLKRLVPQDYLLH